MKTRVKHQKKNRIGRPPQGKHNHFSVYVSDDDAHALREYCASQGRMISWVIEQALSRFLGRCEQEKNPRGR